MTTELTKQFFQEAWGENGYYENFSYGVGIDAVCEKCLYPFIQDKEVLEIGSGGGVFTKRIAERAKRLTAIDVIKRPESFTWENLIYVELPDKNYACEGVKSESIDFAFSYNLFCHLPDHAIRQYLKSVNRVLRQGGSFVFMLSNFQEVKKGFKDKGFKRGDFLTNGHFYQDDKTIYTVIEYNQWKMINVNMIPEHRDIIIHLEKR